jgi:dihydropteroate synthase
MGVVNATPDSFYDGARFDDADAAVPTPCAWWRKGPT